MNYNELEELNSILLNGDITTVFQPIVCLLNGNIIGYEALSRGPEESRLHTADMLFSSAVRHDKIWELESLCRKKAIEKSNSIGKEKFLFLNIDPLIFNDEGFKKFFTKELLAKYDICPESIIFEITEKTAIKDFISFRASIDSYVKQGYKIAIDDTGSGYAGFKMLSETKPHYIKIDMDLIRDVNKDSFKQALIKCFVDLAESTHMLLIAEGIENEKELLTLMELGVYAGQGFLLQRPSMKVTDICDEIKEMITNYNKMLENRGIVSKCNHIGELASIEPPVEASICCKDLMDHLLKKAFFGAVVTSENKPVGLIMKDDLENLLSTQSSAAVFSRRPVSILMDSSPLIFDFYTPILQVAKASMSRRENNTYDYIVITKESDYFGVVTVKNLLEHITNMTNEHSKELNPLTGIPGKQLVNKAVNDILNFNHPSCILYFDIDNFKIYNEKYGFENGDKLLKFTGYIIKNEVKKLLPYNSFVGHIGEDDFVCIVDGTKENCDLLCNNIISKFDKGVLSYFNEKDILNGYIEGSDNKKYNLTSISAAGLYCDFSKFSSEEDIYKYIIEMRKDVKRISGSCYQINE